MDWHWSNWAATACLATGSFFALTGAVGVLRMPDFYTRVHPAGVVDTLGQALVLVGLMFLVGDDTSTAPLLSYAKLALIVLVLLVTAPVAAHAITKAAHLDGLEPLQVGEDEHAPEHLPAFDRQDGDGAAASGPR